MRVRASDGEWQPHSFVQPFDSMLSELADPQRAPDVLRVRETMRSWRFYDHVRTDADAPDLLRPLASIVVAAAARAQTVVVTHSRPLASALEITAERAGTDLCSIELVKEFGETTVAGPGRFDGPSWVWPKR